MAAEESRAWNPDLAADYDRIADRYAEAYFDELDRKPFDRELLDRFARTVGGRVCDIGCGPGHVARYLQSQGVEIFGIDLSPRMIEVARRLNPAIPFHVSDMRTLDLPSCSLRGIVSFYAIIHLRREALLSALREMSRVLQPAGRLLLSCHRGQHEVHADEWFGQRVSVDVTFLEPAELAGYLAEAGFRVDETHTRRPYDFEVQTERVYISAAKLDDLAGG